MKFGLLGGTFDPPHNGHLIVAQDAAVVLGLDRIVFVPAALPPHKAGAVVSPVALRTRMLELALADDPRFLLDTLELERPGPSYTVDTLRELHRRRPGEWTLLMGADQYAEFGTWREPAEIRRLARLVVIDRAGMTTEDAPAHDALPVALELDDDTRRLAVTRIDISSTAVRARVAAGLPIRYLVPDAVERLIREERLYVRNGTPLVG